MSDDESGSYWRAVRRSYEGGYCSRYGVARRYAIPFDDLLARAKANKWSEEKRSSSTDRMLLIERILGALEHQVAQMEMREMSPTGEKEAAVLGKLTNTLGTLIGLARAEAPDPAGQLETAEMRDIRQQLSKRIDEITKG
jgi:hypothetical protein